jgi:hypothetical protein
LVSGQGIGSGQGFFFSLRLSQGVGWLIPHCARPTKAFFLFFFQSRMERMRGED